MEVAIITIAIISQIIGVIFFVLKGMRVTPKKNIGWIFFGAGLFLEVIFSAFNYCLADSLSVRASSLK